MYIDLKEELIHQLAVKEDADYNAWPEASIELSDFRWQPAEPDVGIMSAYIDDYSMTAYLGDRKFTDMPKFATALYEAIGKDIEETRDELAELLTIRVENAAADIEADDDYDDYARCDDD